MNDHKPLSHETLDILGKTASAYMGCITSLKLLFEDVGYTHEEVDRALEEFNPNTGDNKDIELALLAVLEQMGPGK